ncbi:MAG: ribokinase [Candidatus Omnitrophota bacterium]|nr:ribokinase [Candidatus Omnitrophota bacterium]
MITVVGSSNTDFSVRVESLPKKGQTVLGSDFIIGAGGKGANQAVQISRLGSKIVFVARIGRDYFGDKAVSDFKKTGINTAYIIRDKEHPSGAAVILVDKKGNNQIAVAPSSNRFLSVADINKAKDIIRRSKVLLAQLEIPLASVKRAIDIAKSANVTTILNPAPFRKLDGGLLRKIDVLTPNETEAEGLTGVAVKDVNSAVRSGIILLKRGLKSVIITLGSLGSVIVDSQGATHLPAPKVKAVDTTAAGDSFCGALAVSIAEGKSLVEAADFANCCAAISVTRPGAQLSLPTRREVTAFFR